MSLSSLSNPNMKESSRVGTMNIRVPPASSASLKALA
jgi:hypothetical protein